MHKMQALPGILLTGPLAWTCQKYSERERQRVLYSVIQIILEFFF